MSKALYPGSFDPITYGHMDVISQALKIFNEVIICIMQNSSKNTGMFTLEERKDIIERIYPCSPRIKVVAISDPIASVDVAMKFNCSCIIRGLRDITDFAVEKNLSDVNFSISNEKINTIAFFANPSKTTISSSIAKELHRLNKNISCYVPDVALKEMNKRLN